MSSAESPQDERIWLQEYPPGVPQDIEPQRYASVKAVIEESCERYADKPAFSNMEHELTYRELDRLSAAFGAWLQHGAGLRKGDRVAVMLPNLLQYPVAAYGILRAGMTVVNVNPMYTPRELRHQLSDSGASAIVILKNFANTLVDVRDDLPDLKHVITTQIGDMLPWPKSAMINAVVKYVKKLVPPVQLTGAVALPAALKQGASMTLDDVALTHDDLAFLQYTGGTTGVAKGAMLTHGNMVSNLEQSAAWLSPVTSDGSDIVITALPLYHIFSLTANCLVFTKIGGKNVLITDPRDMAGFIGELRRHRFTAITGVNTLFNGLLHAEGFSGLDFGPLKITLGGGMAVQRAVAERWAEVTGKPLIEAYGLTETSPAACINPLTIEAYNGSIGVPISSTHVTVRDDDGNALPRGDVGEICIGGPQVMKGYWQRPEDTDKVMTEAGDLRTGDMGYVDERGYVFITDRKKDMILVSGFNVYPNEIEDVVVRHPAVLEAAAIGVPDPKSCEAVKLFVVCDQGQQLDKAAIIAHCREHLTNYKVPRHVEFREDLPKSNVGKILRRTLRDEELAAKAPAAEQAS
ncbi:MAG: AMP-binding protein [Pseudomonadota bacterium]